MNKPLLLCLLLAMWGQGYAQNLPLKNFKEAHALQMNWLGDQVSEIEKNKLKAPTFFTSKSDKVTSLNNNGKNNFPEYWPDRLYLKLKNGPKSTPLTWDKNSHRVKAPNSEKLNNTFQRHGVNKLSELPESNKNKSGRNTYELIVEVPGQAQQLMQELNALPEVEYAERVPFYVTLTSPNDPAYLANNQYALQKTQATEAFGIHTGKGTTLLAIVDDAVLINHPDLAANINTAKSYDVADKDADPRPPAAGANMAGMGRFSHGTHCAGIAGAVTNNGTGVAAISNNKVSIIGVKCTRDAAPSSQAIEYATEGIVYAINQGAKVISMSFGGGGYSQTIQNIINEATANGVVFVAAAGNNNTETKMYPAAYDNVIAVASTDANDLKSSFSNYGSWVDIAAPGTAIFSTVTDNDGISGTYTSYSGTSMACPMVASLVAYILSENPNLTPQAVTQILRNTADPLENVLNQSPGLAGKLGGGRINAYRAIKAVKEINNTAAPAAVTNLRVNRTGQIDLEIQWSAPDAGGQAASLYDIRYATTPITPENFEAATKVKQNIFPAAPGVSQMLVIKELMPSTTYYIALVAKSFYGEASSISNGVSATTLDAPSLEVNPTSLSLTLNRANGNFISRNFSAINTGAATLNYNASVVPIAGSNILAFDKNQQTADNSVGLGGPGFISAAKFVAGASGFYLTQVQNFLNSSVTTGNVNIGIRILKGGTNPGNATLLTTQTNPTVIPAGGSLFNYQLQVPQQFAPGETFWIVFDLPNGIDYPQGFDVLSARPGTFYLSLNKGASYDDAQTLANFLANAAFKIRAVNADWVTLSPASGNIMPGQTGEVNLTFNGSRLLDGVYQFQVLFQSNDPFQPLVKRAVNLTVSGGQPLFWMDPAEVDFGTLIVGSQKTVKVNIANKGTATLNIIPGNLNSEPFPIPNFTIKIPETLSLPPNTQQEVLATFNPTQIGILNGTVVLNTNNPTAPIITVPLKGRVVLPPVAVITPPALNFEMDFSGNKTDTQAVFIQNKGEADLEYTLQAMVEPLAQIRYDANRQPDNFLGFGTQSPDLHAALKVNVNTPVFNLTHVQNFIKNELAGKKNITLKVFKGGNLPMAGTLLLQQTFEVLTTGANGSLLTFPLSQPLQFIKGEDFWLVFDLTGFSQPQGYHMNTPNPGRSYYSSNGTNWYTLESAGGNYTTSTFTITALEMPQWLSVLSGTSVTTLSDNLKVTNGGKNQSLVQVNAAGLPKGRYKGNIQVQTNDPNRPLTTIEVNMQLEEFPVAAFSAAATAVLPGEKVDFVNSSKYADAYEWAFEGAEPVSSTLANPTVFYTSPGKYRVTLTSKNTQTNRTSGPLLKEAYIEVANTLCQELNSPFTGNAIMTTTSYGYISGNNQNKDLAKANYFNYNRPHAYITGVKVKFGAAHVTDVNATLKIAVWDNSGTGSAPGKIIAVKDLKITQVVADVNAGRATEVIWETPVPLTGSFYAGVILNNQTGNTVAIFHNNTGMEPIAWTQDSQNNWNSFKNVWADLPNTRLYIQPTITQTLTPIRAAFSINAEQVCVGEPVLLDASATMAAVRYEWFLEGASATSSTELKPRVTYNIPGTYTITLKTYDACSGVAIITKTITVNSLPDATTTASGSTTLCAGEQVTLSAVTGNGYTYRWSNGATTRSILVSTPGEFTVTITNITGCEAISPPILVRVNPLPTAIILASGPVTFCTGGNVTLTASEGSNYLWSNGATTRQITVTSAGDYQVTVFNAAGCQASSSVTKVIVNPLPMAIITPNGATTFCQGGKVTLTAPEGAGYSYRWSNGENTRTITVNNSETYRVIITNPQGCSVTSEGLKVEVNPRPVAVIATDGPTTFCQGDQVMLTAPSGNGYTYRWSNGATTPSIKVSSGGEYAVTVTSPEGCSTISEPVEIKVNALPLATITPDGSTTFCAGNQVILTASEGTSYLWSNGANTRSITVSESGNFSVEVSNSTGCTATSGVVKMQKNLLPGKPSIIRKDVILTSNARFGNQWYRNNSAIPSSQGIYLDATEPGIYQVQVANEYGCVSEMSEKITITKEDLITDLTVYPNPGNGRFILSFTGLKPVKISIQIFNTLGKVVYENKHYNLPGREGLVDITQVAAGVYILQVQQNGRKYNRRIVVQP